MRWAVTFLLFAFACSVDHVGLLPTPGEDAGPEADTLIRDSGTPDPDVALMPDVFDGGPVPLPMDCTMHVARDGDDEASGSVEEPLATIGAALAREMPVVCVSEGRFNEALRVTGDVLIRGGYCTGFQRLGCETVVRGPDDHAMRIRGMERIHVELEGLSLESGSAAEAGGSAYGIQVAECDLIVRDSLIRAADGMNGADALAGTDGVDGDNGDERDGGDECSTGGRGGGTSGGPDPGGDGEGASGDFGRGGAAGSGGNGNDGSEGGPATGGAAPGTGGSGGAITTDVAFQPSAGLAGENGAPGGGGGGGGAGNSGFLNVGGGGGGGGCGGGGGAGGGGGGGSFGIIALRSSVTFQGEVTVVLGRGGVGGSGGQGGQGGRGGNGRDGGTAIAGRGGRGGNGGQGGPGGGGGGGQGGPAVAVLLGESSLMGVLTLEGGEGGAGGGGGMTGTPGVVMEQLSLDIL